MTTKRTPHTTALESGKSVKMSVSEWAVDHLCSIDSPHAEHFAVGDELHVAPVCEEEAKKSNWCDPVFPVRIPRDGATNPTDDNRSLPYHHDQVQGFAVSGWNWKRSKSKFVILDIDADDGHENGLSQHDLAELNAKLIEVPWIQLHRSKGGHGFHIYVWVTGDTNSVVRKDHRELALYVQDRISDVIGLPLHELSCAVGELGWIYDRDAAPNGFELIKKADHPLSIDEGWRHQSHLMKGKRLLRGLASERMKLEFNAEHQRIIDRMRSNGWDVEVDSIDGRWFMRTHTGGLAEAKKDLKLPGVFETCSAATNPSQPNCFAFPGANGELYVYRFSQGCQEAKTWTQDGQGWTRCIFNQRLDFEAACKQAGAVRNSVGNFIAKNDQVAINIMELLDCPIEIPTALRTKPVELVRNEDSVSLKIRVPEPMKNESFDDWTYCRRVFECCVPIVFHSNEELTHIEDCRFVVSPSHEEVGFVCKDNNDRWITVKKDNAKSLLKSKNYSATRADLILGHCVRNNFVLMNEPFCDEYPEPGYWNKDSPRMAFVPSSNLDNLQYSNWTMIWSTVAPD